MAGLRRLLATAVAATLALPACADGDGGAGPTTSAPAETPASTTTTTAPARTSGFLAFGDFGGGEAQDDVAGAMRRFARRHRVDALVTTGDNVYKEGHPSLFEARLDRPYRALRRDRPLWVTLGNHDVQGGYGDQQLSHLGLPRLPYARRLPGVQLLFLDANRDFASQEEWLRDRLTRPGPRLRVVVFHQPPYSCGKYAPGTPLTPSWVDTFEEFEVALVLNGHDHNYQRFRSPNDVHYVITGGGGYSLYELAATCDLAVEDEARASRYHFVHVLVKGRRLTLRAVGTDGEVFDRVVIQRSWGVP